MNSGMVGRAALFLKGQRVTDWRDVDDALHPRITVGETVHFDTLLVIDRSGEPLVRVTSWPFPLRTANAGDYVEITWDQGDPL